MHSTRPEPRLPWTYEILACKEVSDGWFILTRKESGELCTHWMNQDGDCFYGHYFTNAGEAWHSYRARV